MSLSGVTIKTEQDNYALTDEITIEHHYPKEALDLSKKNTQLSEHGNDKPAEMRPEFVNIKMEIETTIKEEPNSDPEDSQPLSYCTSHTQPVQAHCVSNGFRFKVEVKQEPLDPELEPDPVNDANNKQPEPNKTQPDTSKEDEDDLLNHNATPDGKYMCPVCHNRFATKGLVQRHQLLHSKEKLQCTICSKSFVKAGHLKKHVLSHSSVKSFECPDCGKLFRTTSNLEQHKKTHLAVKPFKCEVCDRQFAVKANLVKHQGKTRCKRRSDQPITCNVCHKTFTKEFLLKSHLRRHTTEKPYSCETCDVNFKYKSTLIRHIQLHNGVKPYSCKICQKTFTHAGLIKPHMRKHTGEKPYPCPICKKLFAHKHNMERHTLRHNKIKHLDCHICHKKFPKESRLRYHMRIHTNEKPFACKVCPKKFSHKQNVIRHYSRKHPGKVYDCEKTDASVARDVWEAVVQQHSLKAETEDFEPIESCESNDEYVIP